MLPKGSEIKGRTQGRPAPGDLRDDPLGRVGGAKAGELAGGEGWMVGTDREIVCSVASLSRFAVWWGRVSQGWSW